MPNSFSSLAKTLIIAEIGVNHNGDLDLAKQMIIEAKNCGADAVKFQTFKAEDTRLTQHSKSWIPKNYNFIE